MPDWIWISSIAVILLVIFLMPKQLGDDVVGFLLHSNSAKIIGVISGFIGFGAILLTYYAISVEITDRADERAARNEERINRYIERLLDRAPGDTGKGRALGALLEAGEFIDGADLSCKALGYYDEKDGCSAEPQFNGIVFRNGETANVYSVNFNDDSISGADVASINFRNTSFDGVSIYSSRFYNSQLQGSFNSSYIQDTEIVLSYFDIATGRGWPRIVNSNISSTVIPWLTRLNDDELGQLYFWADSPPYRSLPWVPITVNNSVKFPLQRDSPIYGTDILSKMHACRPPLSPGGENLPPKGEIVPLYRRKMIKFLINGRLTVLCDPINITEAMFDYPEGYVVKQTVIQKTLAPNVPLEISRDSIPIEEPW